MHSRETVFRQESVGELHGWTWPATDTGAWTGPKMDWETSHSHKYLQYLKGRRAVVTAGANCGMYARHYGYLFETVYAFEPDPLNFYCLVNNCQLNNVIKMQCALGEKAGLISINRNYQDNVGMNTVNEDETTDPRFPLITIDSLNLRYCDLIQLDVEGYETKVLLGAKKTIKKFSPVIILENGERFNQEIIAELGYEYVDSSVSDDIYVKRKK